MRDQEAEWARLLRQGLRGDARCYELFLSGILDSVRRLVGRRAARFGLAGDDIEDIVQEVLIGIHLKRATWDGERPILPWLNGIVRHKTSDALRQRRQSRQRHADVTAGELADVLAAPGLDKQGVVRAEIEPYLAPLTKRERGVVAALALEGATVDSLARKMKVSENAIHAAWARGLARLAGQFGKLSPVRGKS